MTEDVKPDEGQEEENIPKLVAGVFMDTQTGEFQVARAGWIGDYQDPNTFLDMFVTGAAMNGGKYTNARFDELIHKAARMAAGPDRMKVLMEAESIFIEQDMALIPIYHYARNNMIDTGKEYGKY